MLLKYLSGIWPTIAPAVGNHLWQSTLFAIAAGLLTLAFRKNGAQVRYSLWLVASVKFLLPFSVLVAVGSHLRWSRNSAEVNTGLSFIVQQVGQPFMEPTMVAVSPANPSVSFTNSIYLINALFAAWLCGLLIVVFLWVLRWRRLSQAIRQATPLQEGREVEVMRRLEEREGIRKPTEILLSRASVEPGIFGILRPVLVWPVGITARLEDSHLEAVLAHELSHIRRHDNLASAIHMLTEAIFWFHPMVWWLGSRLMEERERACDEEVLESGRDRQIYAESILKICEFCVESPLTCFSGVTGADLKKRVVRIMSDHVVRKTNLSKKVLLVTGGALALALPIVAGLLSTSQGASTTAEIAKTTSRYEVASVRIDEAGTTSLKTGQGVIMQSMIFTPGTFTAQNASLRELIRTAYGVKDYQILGLPDSFDNTLYDVNAMAGRSVTEELKKAPKEQAEFKNQAMLQALLIDRFKLAARRETRESPFYSLVVSEPGKLPEALGDCGPHPNPILVEANNPQPPAPCGDLRVVPWVGHMDGVKVPMNELAANLSEFSKRMVVDKTKLAGRYDISLKWFPAPTEFPPRPAYLPASYLPDPDSPPLQTALQQQLGLKLETQTGPVAFLRIDHVEEPKGN